MGNTYDPNTQRRSSLALVAGASPNPVNDFPAYHFGWHVEGSLASVGFESHSEAAAKEFSYGFDRKGQITSRTSPWRRYTVTDRDASGRLKTATTSLRNYGGGPNLTVLQETLAWHADSRQARYTAARTQVGQNASLPTDVRDYAYHATSRRLMSEDNNIAASGPRGAAF